MNNNIVNGSQNNNQVVMINNKRKNNSIIFVICIIVALLLVGLGILFLTNKNNNTNKNNINKNIDEEESKYIPTATDKPVSKNWNEYQFNLNGKTLSLPCNYKELKEISGFSMKSKDEKTLLDTNSITNNVLYTKDSKFKNIAMFISIANNKNKKIKYINSDVVEVWQTKYHVETNKASVVTFPGGLKAGMKISKDEIVKMYGEPSKISELNGFITLSYSKDEKHNEYYEITLSDNTIDNILLANKILKNNKNTK